MTPGPAWRLLTYDTLPSTSDACIAHAEAGEPEGLAVLARTQTLGRGSRGRSWSQASGTLALSVLLRPSRHSPLWPFVAGLALHAALVPHRRLRDAIRLKWPNDVMLALPGQEARKLGGILIEASPAPDGRGWLVIGFGANLAEAPALADRQAACLAELGPVASTEAIVDRLLRTLGDWVFRLAQGERIRDEWLACAHPVGTRLAVRTPDGQITGSFSSIAEDGTLLLDVAGEIRRFNTGEVLLVQGA